MRFGILYCTALILKHFVLILHSKKLGLIVSSVGYRQFSLKSYFDNLMRTMWLRWRGRRASTGLPCSWIMIFRIRGFFMSWHLHSSRTAGRVSAFTHVTKGIWCHTFFQALKVRFARIEEEDVIEGRGTICVKSIFVKNARRVCLKQCGLINLWSRERGNHSGIKRITRESTIWRLGKFDFHSYKKKWFFCSFGH